MAIQQVLTIYLNLKGDGASSAFSFALQNLYQFENGIAVPFGGAGVVPTAVSVNNPPVPVTSVVIDANGNITLTTTSALPASVFTFQLDLTFNSGSSTSSSATQTTNVTVVGSSSVTANQGGAPWSQNLTQVAGVALGAPSAYGTGPGAVNVLGVNAFVTNAVTISGNIGISAASNTDRVSTGSITTTQSIAVGIASASSVIIQVSGAWTGTLVFEYSADNSTFIALPVYPVPSGTSVTSTTANGVWMVPVGGFATVRVRGNSVASGTASINIESSMGGLTYQMVQPTAANLNTTATLNAETTKVIGTTRITGNVGGAMDAAGQNAASPANELLVAGQFNTTPTTITTGNVSPLQLDSAGNLRVTGSFSAGALPDATTAISLTAVAQTASVVLAGRNSTSFILTSVGTGGAVQAEGSIDGANWFSIDVWSEALEAWITGPISATGQWWFEPLGALNAVRIRVTAITSGTITGNLLASTASMGTYEFQTSAGQSVPPNILAIGGSVTTAAPAYTTGTANSLSLDTLGALRTTTTDTAVASTALGALNAAITTAVQSQTSVGFQLAAGTLIGTITPELSVDGGNTWVVTQFVDPVRSSYFANYIFTASNTLTVAGIDTIGGTTHVRVRVSAFTSGTANAVLNAGKAGRSTVTISPIDGQKVTYRAGFSGVTTLAIPALFQFTGSSTKISRITRIGFSASAATGVGIDLTINRLSAIGTSAATATIGKMDQTDPASTSVVTRNSAGGTVAALITAVRYVLPTSPATNQVQEFRFGEIGSKALMVRSNAATETIGVGLSATGTTGVCDFWIEWTEE